MSLVSGRRKRQVAVALLTVLLALTVVGANAAVGAERTVLDETFVTEGLAAEGFYETVADSMAETLQPENGSAQLTAGLENAPAPPVDEMAAAAVTPAYVRSEVERNVGNLSAYLDGSADALHVRLDLGPVKSAFAEEAEAWAADLEPAALDPRMARLASNESSFAATRTDFKETQLDRIQAQTDEDYSRAELEAIYDDNRDRVREQAMARLSNRVSGSGAPPPLQDALLDYGAVGVDALVAEDASYDEFAAAEADARADVAGAIGDVVRGRLDASAEDSLDMTAGMDDSTRGTLETARSAVSLLGILSLVLPLLAVVLGVLLVYASPRRSNGLWCVGGVLAFVGVVYALALWLLGDALPGLVGVQGDDVPEAAVALIGLLTQALSAIGLQSLLVAGLGLALVVAGVAVRREYLPVEDDPDA